MSGYGHDSYGHGPWGFGVPDEWFAGSPYVVPAGHRFGSVPLRLFSGEPSDGLLSGASGLVFFSPALLEPSSSSEMELASISVRAVASDSYSRPEERSQRLFRFGGGASLASGWGSLSNSALYRAQPLEYTVVATLVQTTPPGPTTVIKIP